MTNFAIKSTMDELARQNVIDSRDLVERQREILSDLDALEEEKILSESEAEDAQELRDELKIINDLIDEIEGYSGDSCRDGVTLVAESFWVEYAQELADDIGAVDRNASWPNDFIDWDRAADALKQDYTSVDINGTEYWYR